MTRPSLRFVRPALVALSAALALVPSARAEETSSESEDWMAVYVAGSKCGWSHHKVAKADEAGRTVWVSNDEKSLTISRMKQAITIELASTVVEDEAGQVLRFTSSMKQGPMGVKTEGTVADGDLGVADQRELRPARQVEPGEGLRRHRHALLLAHQAVAATP